MLQYRIVKGLFMSYSASRRDFIVGYNYVDRWRDRRKKFYSIDRHAYPDRRFVGR